MTVRRLFSVVAAILAVFVGSGCGERAGAPLPAETDEAFYVQGKQLMKQGRNPEALSSFLKVIYRRGEQGAPESHLEAGYIYFHHMKDPVKAYHHFREYLALQPNSKEAVQVKGMASAALREFARTLPARPLEDQSARMQSDDIIERQRREIEELRAQIATLRGGGAAPVSRPAPTISLPDALTPGAVPPPVTGVTEGTSAAPPPRTAQNPGSATTPVTQPSLSPPRINPATPPRTTTTPATTPTRPGATGGRSHVVTAKETLFGISRKYYGNDRQVEAIFQANRDVMKDKTDLRPGMTLKIPAVDATAAPRR